MPLTPLGVNYFIKTGQKCPNGEPMYSYIQGIPKGDALGKRVRNAMASSGLPALKGLGPGIIEDAKDALDPTPILNAAFGTGYPDCVQVELPVGDQFLQIKNPTTGKYYISEPQTAYQKGPIWVQRRWIQKLNAREEPIFLTKEQYDELGGGKPVEETFKGGGRSGLRTFFGKEQKGAARTIGYIGIGTVLGFLIWKAWTQHQRKN
jgi:hypothetical protein